MTTTDIAAPAPAEQRIVVDELVTGQGVYGLYELGRMRRSPDNRKRFNEAALQELAASIKAMGVAQPILIRPVTPTPEAPEEYEIVAGERRYRASIIAGLATIPALCRNLSDLDAAKIRILENLQREDPHPIEEAEGYQLLMRQHGYDADQLAEEVSKSRSYIYGRLKLCALTDMVRDKFFEGKISPSIALLIARIPVKALQEKCLLEIMEAWNGVMSFRAAAKHIESNYMLDLKKAVFKIEDATLLLEAGACSVCPKRAGNQPEVFTDVGADVCTDPTCFKAKGENHRERVKLLAHEAGTPVISGDAAKRVMARSWVSELKGGYVAVDERMFIGGKFQTYRELAGGALPPTTLLESPFDKTLHHIVQLPALEANGVAVPSKDTSSSAREREMEAAAKLEREYRKRLLRATHDASLMMNLVDEDLRLVAEQMLDNLPWGTVPTKFLIELYGWTEEMFNSTRRPSIKAAVAALTPAQLNQFIRDCALCRDIEINVYFFSADKSKSKPENMLAFAERTKVDAKKIRAEVDAEAQAKKDKKKPAAKKAQPAATPPKPARKVKAVLPKQVDLIEHASLDNLAAAPPKIDVDHMQLADMVAFVRAHPERLAELTQIVLHHPRGELLSMLQTAATGAGYTYAPGGVWTTEKLPKNAWPFPTSSTGTRSPEAVA